MFCINYYFVNKMVRSEYLMILLIGLFFMILVFLLSTADPVLMYSDGRNPPLPTYHTSPQMALAYIVHNNSPLRVLSPELISGPGTDYSVPVAHYNPSGDSSNNDRYVFNENGRRFGSIGEKLCCKILEEHLGRQVKIHERPDFLKNPETGRNLELDVYDPITKVAIEYNGQNHYDFVERFHNDMDDVNRQKKRDLIKINKCVEAGVKLIIVPYTIDVGKKGSDGKWRTVSVSQRVREMKLRSYILPFLT